MIETLSGALAVGLLAGCFFPVGSDATPVLAAAALLGGAAPAVAGAPWTDRGFRRGIGAAAVAGLVAGVLMLGRLPSWYRFPAPALAFASAAALAAPGSPRARRLTCAAGATLLYAGFDLVRAAGPLAGVLPGAADRICAHLGRRDGASARLGSLHLALPVFAWAAGFVVLAARCRAWRALLGLAALAATLWLQLRLQSAALTWLLTGLVLFRASRQDPARASPPPAPAPFSRRRRLAWFAAAGAAVAGAAGVAWMPREPAPPGAVVIARDGYFRLDVATDDTLGPAMRGPPPFGLLRDLLALRGTPPAVVEGPIPDAVLRGARTLVFINPSRRAPGGPPDAFLPIPEDERRRIDAWVRGGGRLLVLGDHTNVEGLKTFLDPLLDPMGIAFRFDSTIPDRGARVWFRGIESFPHPTTLGSPRPGSFRTGIGASLALRGAARPILVAHEGYADEGDPENAAMAYLGNYTLTAGPDPWEKRGDLVVAAEAEVGTGRVLVYGDTMSFHNDAAPHTWGTILRAFAALESAAPRAALLPSALLLAVGLAALAALASRPAPLALAAAALAATLALVHARNARTWEIAFPAGRDPRPAVVDLSHHPRYDPDFWNATGLDGLFVNLRRRGFFPAAVERWDSALLDRAGVAVLPASAAPLSEAEADDLDLLLARGGLVVAAAGAPDAAALRPWLRRHDMDIESVPLGPAEQTQTDAGIPAPSFRDVWPVRPRVPGAKAGWKTIASAWDRPVIVEMPASRGRIVLIGDSRFFANENLESLDAVRDGNVAFAKWLFGGP